MKFYKEKTERFLKENNITMYRLARRMGISNSTVSAWFRGMRFPRERNIVLMAKALDISVTEISDMKEVHDISAEVSGYFQGWGSSLNKSNLEIDDPCIRAIKEIENIKSEQYRLRTVTRTFMSTMQSMLYVKNFHGKYILANESFLKAIGLDININVIGKTDKDFMSQKVALINDTQDISIINTGKPLISKSLKFPFPNSKIKWCVMTKVPLRDNNQNIVGLVASFTDITVEHHLRKQDKILNEAIKQSNAAIGVTSINSGKRKLVYVNDSMLNLIGCSREELKKDFSCWYKNVKEENVPQFEEYLANNKQERRGITFGYNNPMTGKLIFIRVKSLRGKDSNYMYTCFYDETEKIKQEKEKEKLAVGFRLLGSFIDEAKFALFVGEYKKNTLDLVEYTYRNKKSYNYIDDNGKIEDIIAPEHREELLKIADNKRYPRKMIYNIVRKDGTIGSIEEKIRVQEENGKKYFFSLIADIKKQDKIEVLYPETLN